MMLRCKRFTLLSRKCLSLAKCGSKWPHVAFVHETWLLHTSLYGEPWHDLKLLIARSFCLLVHSEGARIHLNPTSKYFNMKMARRYINFAVQFTPQYGDTFVELLRLQFLIHGLQSDSPLVNITQVSGNGT